MEAKKIEKKNMIMFMMRPVNRLIIGNVNRTHSLGYPWRAFQRESLFDQLRAMRRDSVVYEREVHEHL